VFPWGGFVIYVSRDRTRYLSFHLCKHLFMHLHSYDPLCVFPFVWTLLCFHVYDFYWCDQLFVFAWIWPHYLSYAENWRDQFFMLFYEYDLLLMCECNNTLYMFVYVHGFDLLLMCFHENAACVHGCNARYYICLPMNVICCSCVCVDVTCCHMFLLMWPVFELLHPSTWSNIYIYIYTHTGWFNIDFL
jgi:hypothetical protein